jgi:hypothetical protein
VLPETKISAAETCEHDAQPVLLGKSRVGRTRDPDQLATGLEDIDGLRERLSALRV